MQARKEIAAVFLLLLFLGSLLAMLSIKNMDTGFHFAPVAETLNGETAKEFEKSFTENNPLFAISRNIWSVFDYKVFRDGRPGVVIGDNGWLFTSEEFAQPRNAKAVYKSHIEEIENTLRVLKDQGIRTVIVLVPAKARLFESHLDGQSYPLARKEIYQDFMVDMRHRNIDIVDLSEVLQQERMFLKTDTHWSPQGAEAAAIKISSAIRCSDCHESYLTEKLPARDYAGDLLSYIPGWRETGLKMDRIDDYRITLKEKKNLDTASLFGDEKASFVLIGTSFSAKKEFHFADFLERELRSDVVNYADEGLGPFTTMRNWRGRFVNDNQKPAIVIWEIPERYLTMADAK